MGDYDYLNPFRNSDGSISSAGSENAGKHEKKNNYTPAPQQSWENSEAYTQRINSNNE